MRLLKAVIFDMDGVLLDSEPLHKEAVNLLMKKLGIDSNVISPQEIIGMSLDMIWSRIIEKGNLKLTLDKVLQMQDAMTYDYFKDADLVETEGVTGFLQELKSHNMPVGVASSASVDLIRLILKKLSLDAYIDMVCGVEEVEHPKPSPEIYLLAAKRLGVEPQECLVVEDSEVGITAAKAAAMKCVALRNLHTPEDKQRHADLIVDGFPMIDHDRIVQLFKV